MKIILSLYVKFRDPDLPLHSHSLVRAFKVGTQGLHRNSSGPHQTGHIYSDQDFYSSQKENDDL